MKKEHVFCNPVPFSDGKRHTNPDPFVMRWCGAYYCYATDEFGVKVSVSENLTEWTAKGYAIKEEAYRNYWAPSVIYRNGTFYMYYSNVPAGGGDCHEECLKLAVSDRPEGPFKFKKTFFDKFSIDSHPLLWNGKLYMFYSVNDWIGTEETVAGTCILVDEMESPEEFAGNPREVVLPGLPQEIYETNRFGDGRDWYTIEGASPVVRGAYTWMLYSANAYVNEDYFVGTAVAENRDCLTDMRWKKYPSDRIYAPLLRKNHMVEGTGHNTVVLAPNLMDDWIVFHGRDAREAIDPEKEQREMYISPLYFSGRRIFTPEPTTRAQERPGEPAVRLRDVPVTERMLLAEGESFYVAEFWISAKSSHAGMRYGILLGGADERSGLELQVHSGKNEIQVLQYVDGIRICLLTRRLEKEFNHTLPHKFRVEKRFDKYEIRIDDVFTVSFRAHPDFKNRRAGAVGLSPYFTQLCLHSFDLSYSLILAKEEMQYLRGIYDVSPAIADGEGLRGRGNMLMLTRNCERSDVTEEFQLRAMAEDAAVIFQREGEPEVRQPEGILKDLMKHGYMEYSVYYFRRKGKEWLMFDGVTMQLSDRIKPGGRLKICLENCRIRAYRLTKMKNKTQNN